MTNSCKYLFVFILSMGLPLFAGAQSTSGNTRLDSMLTSMYAQEDDTNKVKLLNEIADAYHITSPYDGIKFGNQALTLSTDLQWDPGIARSNSVLGLNYYALSKFNDAYSYFQKALKLDEKIDYKQGIANQLQNIGSIYFSQGDSSQALGFYRDALNKYIELGNQKATANAYTAIGNVYAAKKYYSEALRYYTKSLEIDQSGHFNADNDVAADLTNIGSIYAEIGLCSKALVYLFKALDIKKASGDKNGLAKTYGIIGRTFLYVAIDSAGRVAATDTSSPGKSESVVKAIAYLDSAIAIDEEIGFLDNLQKNSRYLSQAQELMLNYKDALTNYKRYSELKDSIYSAANISEIYNAGRKEELEKKNNEIARRQEQHKYFIGGIILLFIIIVLLALVMRFVVRNYAVQKKTNEVITVEKKKSDDLLLNILPFEVANELKEKGTAEARYFDNVTVLFTDFVNFTNMSEKLSHKELVEELNACFSAFDVIMEKHGVEKIKTIGDAYHAACGLPLPSAHHAHNVLCAAMDIRQFICDRKDKLGDKTFEVRIGVHSGSVVAGIVGLKKFTYDIWGDTVNTAARMEQSSEAGKINISQTTYELVKDHFSCTWRGMIEVKNKGELGMYFIENKHS